jgi:hypothetical protein
MCENHNRRKSKVSDGRSVRVGLVGPKPRPAGVGDGQPVNIPVLGGGERAQAVRKVSRRVEAGGKRGKPVMPRGQPRKVTGTHGREKARGR